MDTTVIQSIGYKVVDASAIQSSGCNSTAILGN